MIEKKQLRAWKYSPIAAFVMLAFGAPWLGGCGAKVEPVASKAGDSTVGGAPELIGGDPASAEQFRSTVAINDSCTAAKVGPRSFLTAAHCVALDRPMHGMTPPDGFPQNGGVRDQYLPGTPLLIHWGLAVNDGKSGSFTIARTSIHPSWWACPLCSDPIFADGAADIAVIEISQDTPQIPEAWVELSNVALGTQVVKSAGVVKSERTSMPATCTWAASSWRVARSSRCPKSAPTSR